MRGSSAWSSPPLRVEIERLELANESEEGAGADGVGAGEDLRDAWLGDAELLGERLLRAAAHGARELAQLVGCHGWRGWSRGHRC